MPKLDPQRVNRIYKMLKIALLTELKQKLEAGEIGRTFGGAAEEHVRQGLTENPRKLHSKAAVAVGELDTFLRKSREQVMFEIAGSYRRRKDTVGDLNVVVGTARPEKVLRGLSKFAFHADAPKGEQNRLSASYQLGSGLRLTVVCVPEADFAFELLHETGSRRHLDHLRKLAAQRGIEFSAAGFRRFGADTSSEESLYRALHLEYIAPELRENRGEVGAARRHKLPHLITREDLLGDLHMHTSASDGSTTIRQLVSAAKARGYQYIGITDHSQSLKITNGLSEKRLLGQIKTIDSINEKLGSGFRVLKSAEVDILEDGALDYPDTVLRELDYTICSIHSRFRLDRKKQTERTLRAMDNRYFNILGHATGRLLLKRAPDELEIERIIRQAVKNGCSFKINSSPDRLDLTDEYAKLAKDAGVMIAISTDAHSVPELEFIGAGIHRALRAWLGPENVLNTRKAGELLRLLQR